MEHEPELRSQIVDDLHDATYHKSNANARFMSHQLHLAEKGEDALQTHSGVSRRENTVTVTSKSLVMTVLNNREGYYSVAGYNARAKHCFGEIYLGLDAGPEYERQAAAINAAIGAISAEKSFDLVLGLTRQALAKNGGAVSDALGTVLTDVCHAWFNIPDGKHILPGGVRLDISGPPLCPGDFNFPSALIFYPDPAGTMSQLGAGQGQGLLAGATAFVKDIRASGALPTGPLSRAVLEAFPDDDELAARSLLGIMMGMIPTTMINVTNCLKMWSGHDNAGFKKMGAALMKHGGSISYERAKTVLVKPMVQTIQPTPEPPAVWRTAVREHDLGGMKINAGDKIIVSIMGACRQDLAEEVVTLDPVFGGDRSLEGHPLHACPGSAAAVGFMLGFINAVIEPV